MYNHTQIGWLMLVSLGAAVLFTGYFGIVSSNWIALCVFGVLVVCIILFPSLTVTGDDNLIEVRFGPGLIRKKFLLEDIESCRPVKNQWWYGWGIRKIPRGWLFNVSGLDAVELLMKNGRVYRIGTDEPQTLNEFIQRRLNEGKKSVGQGDSL